MKIPTMTSLYGPLIKIGVFLAIVVGAWLLIRGYGASQYHDGVVSEQAKTAEWKDAAGRWQRASDRWEMRSQAEARLAASQARDAALAVARLEREQQADDEAHAAAQRDWAKQAKSPACAELARESACPLFRKY